MTADRPTHKSRLTVTVAHGYRLDGDPDPGRLWAHEDVADYLAAGGKAKPGDAVTWLWVDEAGDPLARSAAVYESVGAALKNFQKALGVAGHDKKSKSFYRQLWPAMPNRPTVRERDELIRYTIEEH